LARGIVGRSPVLRGRRVPPHPGQAWQGFDRRHHLLALHQRRNLPGPETGARGLRQQQRRHLRARMPLAHRLWPEADPGRIGRHPVVRLGHEGRRHHGDRRQPRLRPSGVRLADEAAAAPGRQADRGRPARHGNGEVAACGGHPSPEAAARHQRRHHQCPRPRGPGRRAARRRLRRRPLRHEILRRLEELRAAAGKLPRGDRLHHRRPGGRAARRRAPVCHRGQRRDLLRPGRDRARPGLDHGDGHRQPRHGHGQRRPRRRGRQSLARPE